MVKVKLGGGKKGNVGLVVSPTLGTMSFIINGVKTKMNVFHLFPLALEREPAIRVVNDNKVAIQTSTGHPGTGFLS